MASVPAVREQFALARASAHLRTANALAEFAKQANAAVMAFDPKPAGFIRTVDGSVGVPEENVRPDGVIVYQYQRIEEAVLFAMDVLRRLSPVKSGAYREAHTIFFNGKAVLDRLPTVGLDDRIVISNLEPYARKIELGTMKMTVSGTDMVYQQARQIVREQFRGRVLVDFTYRGLVGLSSGEGTLANPFAPQALRKRARDRRGRYAFMGGPAAYNRSEVRYPVLTFYLPQSFGL